MDATTDSLGYEINKGRMQLRALVAAQNWKLLQTFNIYRLTIALAACLIALTGLNLPPFGMNAPALFRIASVLYALIAAAALYANRVQRPEFATQATVLPFADVALIALLAHASGGLSSGMGLLLLVAVAGGSLMLGKKLAIFYASIASIAILLDHSWGLLTGAGMTPAMIEGYPQVGMLGVGLFATATVGYTLAGRLRATEALAERRGADLANLAAMNALIIQRMQSGVLVCDTQGRVWQMNRMAQTFLGTNPSGGRWPALGEVSADLAKQTEQWRSNPGQRGRTVLQTRAGYSLLPRFIPIGDPRRPSGALVFLEDTGVLKQQAQQLKMAALARLTASIAHEIRNPLGAITNAAQLLGESTTLTGEESRLAKIIEEQGRRMNRIVENITQLSRRDRVSPIQLSLHPWLQDFLRQYPGIVDVPAEAFAVYGPQDLRTCVDPDQLHQVVTNLCQNALRHSPAYTGKLLIKLQTGTTAEGRPFLDVIDWGTGVPTEIVDNIFEPFFTTTPKGTGLGLYIARELCEANGATLEYHPGDGGVGSRFRVTFAKPEECSELGAV